MSEKETDKKDSPSVDINRRKFLTVASAGMAATMMSATLVDAAERSYAKQIPNEQGPFDLVVSGGRVIDPETGLHAIRNVGIKGNRIAAVSDKPLKGAKTLKA